MMPIKIVAPEGKYRIQYLIAEDGDLYNFGFIHHDEDTLESAKRYADEQKVANAKEAKAIGGEYAASADMVCFVVYNDKGEQVYITDFMLGLQ